MRGGRGETSDLEKAWREAFAEYSREVKKTLDLLNFKGQPSNRRLDEIDQQRGVAASAFDKYRKARRAYIDFLRGAGGLAIVLALHLS
jgi:hypothetical protein